MRSLIGVILFMAFVLGLAVLHWPPSDMFIQDFPADTIAYAAIFSSVFATWFMPTIRSLLAFPVAAISIWNTAGWAGHTFIPAPEQGPICGLPAFAMMILGSLGILLSTTGRALGFMVRERMNSAVATYLVQLIPFGVVAGFFVLANAR